MSDYDSCSMVVSDVVIGRPQPSVWGEKLPFNTVCGEYSSESGGWVHSVGFCPSGDVLAFASTYIHDTPSYLMLTLIIHIGHDSSITIVYPGTGTIITVKGTTLPYITLTWTSEDALVAAGHDCQPILFKGSSQGWRAVGSLDDTTAPKSSGAGARASPVGRLNSAAFNTFRDAEFRGRTNSPGLPGGGGASSESPELLTVHQNTITSVRPYEGLPENVTKVSTSGVDGNLVIWAVSVPAGGSGLAGRFSGLRV